MSYEEIYIAIWITNVYMYCILVTHEYVLLLKLILHATVIAMGQSQLGTACLIQWLNLLLVTQTIYMLETQLLDNSKKHFPHCLVLDSSRDWFECGLQKLVWF